MGTFEGYEGEIMPQIVEIPLIGAKVSLHLGPVKNIVKFDVTRLDKRFTLIAEGYDVVYPNDADKDGVTIEGFVNGEIEHLATIDGKVEPRDLRLGGKSLKIKSVVVDGGQAFVAISLFADS
jgi:hypothetical protein